MSETAAVASAIALRVVNESGPIWPSRHKSAAAAHSVTITRVNRALMLACCWMISSHVIGMPISRVPRGLVHRLRDRCRVVAQCIAGPPQSFAAAGPSPGLSAALSLRDRVMCSSCSLREKVPEGRMRGMAGAAPPRHDREVDDPLLPTRRTKYTSLAQVTPRRQPRIPAARNQASRDDFFLVFSSSFLGIGWRRILASVRLWAALRMSQIAASKLAKSCS